MPRIRQLDPIVINKIAAGEVIERPANVVKELLENSLDALATRIEVDIQQGGTELIRVVDDGEGIHPDDLLLTVSSHATSKIGSADDLFSVQTMGFRGEALASIASVSRFRIRSRQADSTEGWELEVDGGVVGNPQPCGSPPGTIVEVRQLFSNTPVRRKFLKTTATEFGHISEQFTRIAIASPRLHLVLRHNGKTVYELPATNQLIERLRLFYGSELADQLIGVESEAGPIRLWGYVAHPSQSKATRKGQYLFLNGRWIQDRSLQHALSEAYRGLLMVGRHPIVFLFLEMPPDLVDVNVHPTKAEVRFRDSQQLYRQLLSTLRTKFLGMDLDSVLHVSRNNEKSANSATPSPRQQELQAELALWAKDQLTSWTPPEPASSGSSGEQHGSEHADSDEADFGSPYSFSNNQSPGSLDKDSASSHNPSHGSLTAAWEQTEIGPPGDSDGMPQTSENEHPPDREARISNVPLPRAMQVHDCYLIVETEEGLTVIDQHALHERIMYEHLRRRVLAGTVESQRLLVPETLELSPSETAILLEYRELLSQLGFGIEEFGKNTVLLTAYPVMLSRANLVRLVRDVAEQLQSSGQKPTRRDILDHLLHMMSCKAAIKAGQRLTAEEMDSLLAQRHLVDDAHHCPHGRPTALVLSRSELDRQFGRLG